MISVENTRGINFRFQSRNQDMRYIFLGEKRPWAGWILYKNEDGWVALRRATNSDLDDLLHMTVGACYEVLVGVKQNV